MTRTDRFGRALGIAGGAASAVLVVISITFMLGNGWTLSDGLSSYALSNLINGLSLSICGAVLAIARPGNALGWLLLGAGIAYQLSAAATPVAVYAASRDGPPALVAVLDTIGVVAWSLAIGWGLPLALILFPSGRAESAVQRAGCLIVVVAGAAFVAMTLGPFDGNALVIPGYFALAPLWTAVNVIWAVLWLLLGTRLVVLFVRGPDRVRRQTLWVALALLAALVISTPLTLFGLGDNVMLLAFALVPIAILIAVLRYRLLDITLVFSRALAWTLLTSVVVGAFVGSVGLLSTFLQPLAGSTIVALLLALAFDPLRRLLQRSVDRLLYGRRSEPAQMVRLATRGASEGVEAAQLVGQIAGSLRLPWVRLEVDGSPAAESGRRPDDVEELRLALGERPLGRLLVGVRRGQPSLSRADRDILETIAPVIALLARSEQLAADLVGSRRRIVDASEAERLRLQRELHDGVASAMTGLSYRLDAAAAAAPEPLAPVLSSIREDVTAIIAGIRAVVNDLRPPELDSIGLVAALRQRTTAFTTDDTVVDIVVQERALPSVPPSVEVAAYRICAEGIANALRHSGGSRVAVRLWSAGDRLIVQIEDDGRGIDGGATPGVGIASMRERAELLGGLFELTHPGTGTRLRAELPLVPS